VSDISLLYTYMATVRLDLSYYSENTTSIAVVSIFGEFYEYRYYISIIQKYPLQVSLYNNQQYCYRTIYLFTTVRQCVNMYRILNKLNVKYYAPNCSINFWNIYRTAMHQTKCNGYLYTRCVRNI